MTRNSALTLLAAVALAPLSVGAQTPTTSPTTSSTAAYASAKADDAKKVTGCIVAGADGGTFTLTQSAASTTDSATPTSPATHRDSSAPATSSTGASWMLMANSDVDLSKYAGKKVELTGSSDNKSGMSADKTQSTTRSANSTTGPRFHVKSVKVLVETCS